MFNVIINICNEHVIWLQNLHVYDVMLWHNFRKRKAIFHWQNHSERIFRVARFSGRVTDEMLPDFQVE